jgi:ATP synthase protein I
MRSGPLALAGGMGLHCVSGVLAGCGIGYALDKWLDTGFFFWIFLPLGVAAGFLNLYRDAKRLMREQDAVDADAVARKT